MCEEVYFGVEVGDVYYGLVDVVEWCAHGCGFDFEWSVEEGVGELLDFVGHGGGEHQVLAFMGEEVEYS